MKHHYWSCSKFADWLRGTPSIFAGTAEEWESWRKIAKAKKIRYWLAEEGLDLLQRIVFSPLHLFSNLRFYLDNRWISKTHALTSNLKRGQYYDLDTRLLHALFDELVNFVEVEQAWQAIGLDEESYPIPLYYKINRFSHWRCPEAGLAHLEWASQLTDESNPQENPNFGGPSPQALAAKQTIMLYKWWKEIRPNRPDPSDASGWSDYCEKRHREDDELSCSYDKAGHEIFKILRKMEQEQEDEDTEMLISLIKLRGHLWT